MNSIVALPIAGTLIASPSVAATPWPGCEDIELDQLWLKREELIRAEREAYDHVSQIESSIPAWARTGRMYINNKGERCGQICGWPEMSDLPPLPEGGTWRRIRISPQDIKKDYADYIDMLALTKDTTAPGRVQARANYRCRMRTLIERIREARQIKDGAGLAAAEARAERISDERWEAGNAACNLRPSTNQMLARLIIEGGYKVRPGSTLADPDEHFELPLMVIGHLRYSATGAVRATIDRIFDNPTTPLEELDVFPS
jgi:hypothetical protein